MKSRFSPNIRNVTNYRYSRILSYDLAATNGQFHTNSMRSLSKELVRADQLDLPFLVLHPGAHPRRRRRSRPRKNCRHILSRLPKFKTRLRWSGPFVQAHVWEINSSILPTLLAACASLGDYVSASIPRASAGYDISSEGSVPERFREFDQVLVHLDHLDLHLNDSKTAGAREWIDMNTLNIGKGKIGLPAFCFIMRHRPIHKIPKVLETPQKARTYEKMLRT